MPTLTELFTNIANALRAKTGGIDQIPAQNFPAVIAGIQSTHDFEVGTVTATDMYTISVSDLSLGYTPKYIVLLPGENLKTSHKISGYSNMFLFHNLIPGGRGMGLESTTGSTSAVARGWINPIDNIVSLTLNENGFSLSIIDSFKQSTAIITGFTFQYIIW